MRTTGPAQPVEFLLDVLESVTKLQIPYAVVGALAVSYYGVPRSTADADVLLWIAKSPKSSQDLVETLTAAGYQAKQSRGDIDDPIIESIRIEDTHGNRIDILSGIRGMDPDAAGRTVIASLMGTSIRIVGAEDLIAMKVFAAGPQDLADVRGILQVSGKELNLNLLQTSVAGFGEEATTLLEKLLREMLAS